LQQALTCPAVEQLITNTSEKFRDATQTVATRLLHLVAFKPTICVTTQPTPLPHILLNLLGYLLSTKKLAESSCNSKTAVIL
jgi:hypothetical protein